MNTSHFIKTYNSLEKGRFFSTIWCALNKGIIPYLRDTLKPLQLYCEWLSTYGDHKTDAKYLPHISLGQINLQGDNYKKVKEYFSKQDFQKTRVKLSNFTINYAKKNKRKEFALFM